MILKASRSQVVCGALAAASLVTSPVFSQQQQEPPAPAPTKVVRSPGNATWAATAAEARARAATENKFIFVEFDKYKCGNCQRMDHLLYPAFEFEAVLIPMVPVKVMLDSAEGRELARRYEIEDVPSVLVTTATGRLVFEMQGFTNADDFYAHIHQDLDSYRPFARKVDAQNISELSAREAFETGSELYRRKDAPAAEPRLQRALSADDTTPTIRDEARELIAAAQEDLGQIRESRATIDALIATTQDSKRRERAELFRAQLPLAENKPAEAYAALKKFQHDHPNSQYRSQVEAMMTRLETSPPK